MTASKHGRGFTLVELLTTATAAALTLTLAVPSLQSALTGVRRGQVIGELGASLLLARSEAIRRGEPLTLCPSVDGLTCSRDGSPDWSAGWVLFADRDGDWDLDAGTEPIRQVRLERGGFTLRGRPPLERGVRFDATGLPAVTGHYRYCDPGESRELALNTLGRIDQVDTGPGCP